MSAVGLRLDVVNNAEQHFIVRSDVPMRIEVLVVDGKVVAHAYEGTETDMDQEPAFAYDGFLGDENGDAGV